MRVFIIIFLSTVFLKLNAQDIHFSQFKNSKININPALTGDQESDYLAILQRRSQWGSVTDPFKTISIALEILLDLKSLLIPSNFNFL